MSKAETIKWWRRRQATADDIALLIIGIPEAERTPAMIAYLTVQKVMDEAQAKLGDTWLGVGPDEHLEHATHHIENAALVSAGWGEDHVAHAICRVAMALAVRARGATK